MLRERKVEDYKRIFYSRCFKESWLGLRAVERSLVAVFTWPRIVNWVPLFDTVVSPFGILFNRFRMMSIVVSVAFFIILQG